MLQKLRDQTQRTGFKILVGAIIVVLTLFGFGATNLFLAGDPELAQVGDVEITQNVLAAETERERRRLLAQMGPDFDPSNIDRLQLQEYVLQQLISRQVLYQTSSSLGIKLSPEQINDELINAPAYQIDGQFNEAVYRQQVQALGYTPVGFVEEFSNALSAEKLRSQLVDSSILPEWELGEIVRVVNQRRDLAYLPLTVEGFSQTVEVTDDEVTLRYNEDQSAYMTELAVDASYIRLSVDDLLNDPQIEVLEADLRSMYEDDRSIALADEQRDSSHILIQVNDDRDAKQALELITEVQSRLSAGESFEDLASQLSEDPGSASQGGSLGAVGKGIFDPAFENALWALGAPGDVSAPTLSAFGYHLIRLDEIVEPEYPEFESLRGELEQRVRRLKAEELFADRALELERSAYDERYSLDGTAASLGVEPEVVKRVSRSAPGEDLVLNNPAVLNVLFSDTVLDGTNSDAIELSETEIVVVRVDEQYAPEVKPFQAVADEIRQAMVREKALAAIDEAKTAGLARLKAGESVTEIAASLGSSWRATELARRTSPGPNLPAEILQVAFDLPRPAEGEKSVGLAQLPDGAALVTVTRVVQGDLNTTTDADVAEIARLAQSRAARFDFQSFFSAAEERLGVTRPAS